MRQFLWTLCLIVIFANYQILAQSAKKWAIEATTAATTLVGVGIDGPHSAVAAAAMNGVGAIVESFNGTSWVKTQVPGGLLMDGAASSTGLVVTSGMWNVFISTDAGNTFSTIKGVNGLSQSVTLFGPNRDQIGLVGGFTVPVPGSKIPLSVNGVAFSGDTGATWDVSSVPAGDARYGAFPSAQTWYVSSGMWADAATVGQQVPLSSRLSVNKEESLVFNDKPHSLKKSASGATGWFGAVSKTTDGGKTWSQVFSSDLDNDYYYFNGIACSSDSNCVVVGEGQTASGSSLGVVFATADGGTTWEQTLTTNDVSMIGVAFVTGSEFWVSSTQKQKLNLVAQFYHTFDGGMTFKLEEVFF